MKMNNIEMLRSDYYIMEYTCGVCGTKHTAEVPKGKSPQGYNHKCPYCGWDETNSFSFRKPIKKRKTGQSLND